MNKEQFAKIENVVHMAARHAFYKLPRTARYHAGEVEDLQSAAWISVLGKFKVNEIQEKDFGLLYVVASRGIIDYMRNLYGRRFQKSLMEVEYLPDLFPHNEDSGEHSYNVALLNQVKAFVLTLPKQEKEIGLAILKQEAPLRRITARMQVTESRVSQVKQKLVTKIRRRFDR